MYCEGCEEPNGVPCNLCEKCLDNLADYDITKSRLATAIKGMRLAIDTKYNKNIKRVLENTLVKIGEKL